MDLGAVVGNRECLPFPEALPPIFIGVRVTWG